MKISKTLFFLFIFSISFSYGQLKTEKESTLFNTLKFIITQQNTLEGIKKSFPQLSIEANIAELEFNKKYSKALSKIHFEAKNEIGINFKDYLTKLKKELNKNFDLEEMSQKDAVSFIKKVKNRAKGTMPSQYLEILKRI